MTDLAALEDAIAEYGQPNKHGHVTRFSDSSLYDEKCVLCGMVDGSIMSPREQTIYDTNCPANPPTPASESQSMNLSAETVLLCARDEWARFGKEAMTSDEFANAILNVLADPRLTPTT